MKVILYTIQLLKITSQDFQILIQEITLILTLRFFPINIEMFWTY